MHQIASGGLRIDELAKRAGLTVRTLHHYDQIELVQASERTQAGHRRYSDADVRRLYQVVALRSLGVPLARIARALEGDGFTLKDTVTAQLGAVDAELQHARRLPSKPTLQEQRQLCWVACTVQRCQPIASGA